MTFQKGGSSGESVLSITGPGGEVLERRRFAAVDPARQYRLQFSAVSDRLRLDLFDRQDLATPMVSCTARDGRVTEGNDAMYGTKSAGATYDVTIDDYCISQVWR